MCERISSDHNKSKAQHRIPGCHNLQKTCAMCSAQDATKNGLTLRACSTKCDQRPPTESFGLHVHTWAMRRTRCNKKACRSEHASQDASKRLATACSGQKGSPLRALACICKRVQCAAQKATKGSSLRACTPRNATVEHSAWTSLAGYCCGNLQSSSRALRSAK